MNPTTIRLVKEARTLFPLWCFVIIAGLMRLVQRQWPGGLSGMIGDSNVIEAVTFVGFFWGIPMLAILSLGSEFQYGTFAGLLSQPIGRMRVWGEKMSVTLVAVVSAALVFAYAWQSQLPQPVFQAAVIGLVALIGSATYCTLVARSIIGGLALTGTSLWVAAVLAGLWRPWKAEAVTPTWTSGFAFLCYAGVMLWLGGRKLLRFQVTGGMVGDDLMTAGPQFMPEALARLFRSQPSGASLNLIRKEFRLLLPVWLIALLTVLLWLCLTIFGVVPESGAPEHGPLPPAVAIPIVLAGSLSVLIAVLAGSLSLGEERMSGTHAWQLTLPVSARRQWLIKLAMALFTGFVGAVVLPVLVLLTVGYVRGTSFISPREPMSWLFTPDATSLARHMLLLTLWSFWCSCAVAGTWPAVAWLFPAMGAVFFTGVFGSWTAQHLTQTTGTLREILIAGLHLDPRAFRGALDIGAALLWFFAPASLFAVVQSYRMFRTQPQDSFRGIARGLRTLVIIVLVCSFSVSAAGFGGDSFPMIARVSGWSPFAETTEAIEKLVYSMPNQDAPHPLQFTAEDLAKTTQLSPLTRRWLQDARITVTANQAPAGRFASIHHVTTLHLASGLECKMSVTYLIGNRPPGTPLWFVPRTSTWSSCEPAQP